MKGAWGITRDPDGTLASLWEWPWYWRYASGLAIAAVGLVLAIYLDGEKADWVVLTLGGLGILIALSVMYELGFLAIVAAVVWGCSALIGAVFPDIEVGPQTIGVLVAFAAAYACFAANTALKLANTHTRSISEIFGRLSRIDDSRQFMSDDLYKRVHEIERQLKRLENDDLGVRWTP